ncbi:DNA helicase PcrA [Vallitalea sp.]|jgi:DNA helicase-2/ATP-dependent DNA helicase PcrA|uniref:DNA helicase PcrA n=1 Tax=Vallitalea sp. TaxID=1882829 RepID=UPI0025F262CB|nr:DNA helicase PcrA [Vallitalea sp.]MCT4686597.1 DNA helicase PcrA [Vallitalea sp.]
MDKKYDSLNKDQKKAVLHTEGPLLILAGAGSGKTRVLTHRIAYLIEEKKVAPWNILAITFTNKAAKEMRERVDSLVGSGSEDIWVSTFHSTCVRILRRHIDKIGYDRYFTIYDTDDQKKLIRDCMKQLNVDPKQFKENSILSSISSAKDKLLTPKKFEKQAYEYRDQVVSKVYTMYQDRLKKNNALDFDDLLVKTVEVFRLCPDVLSYYQDKFRYIMVDEYQDTNHVQYIFVGLLASRYKNLCVVGDDDQSIYRFRGADISNILDFEKDFRNAEVIKLEQNYRSSKNILEAANQVISNNYGRKNKTLYTDNEVGDLINYRCLQNEQAEAEFMASEIIKGIESEGRDFKDYAILYRTNAQSRVIEERFILNNIPYKIVGGTSFYQRKEIKDILAYLKTINNSTDDIAVKRIINVPRRGIGTTTINKVENYAYNNDVNFFDALCEVSQIPNMTRSSKKVEAFTNFIRTLRVEMTTMSLVELTNEVIDRTGYVKELEREGTDEAHGRIDNIGELISKLTEYENNEEEPTLNGFLEEVALIADIDNYNEETNVVVLMTMHSAKGLEFPCVFISGMEDGLFPSYMSISSGQQEDIEEERRLCYVGITRAKQKLYLLGANSRMIRGMTQYNQVSRFIREINNELFDLEYTKPVQDMPNEKTSYRKNAHSFLKSNPYVIKKNANKMPAPGHFTLNYEVGDLVKHMKFGIGEVLAIQPGGADYEVTVNFPSVGIKKLMARLANLKKD